MLYQPNWFTLAKGNPEIMDKHMAKVDKEINRFKDDISKIYF